MYVNQMCSSVYKAILVCTCMSLKNNYFQVTNVQYNDKHLRSTTVLFGDGRYTITCFSKLLQKILLLMLSMSNFVLVM